MRRWVRTGAGTGHGLHSRDSCHRVRRQFRRERHRFTVRFSLKRGLSRHWADSRTATFETPAVAVVPGAPSNVRVGDRQRSVRSMVVCDADWRQANHRLPRTPDADECESSAVRRQDRTSKSGGLSARPRGSVHHFRCRHVCLRCRRLDSLHGGERAVLAENRDPRR